jgi:hypothetical protein
MNSLIASRTKVEEWVQHEKADADREAEEYRQQLMQEQKLIGIMANRLLTLQLQCGLSVAHDGEEKNQEDNLESIAHQRQALEEQRTLLESEIRKLESSYETRKKRVQGEQFKQFLSVADYWRNPANASILCRNHNRRREAATAGSESSISQGKGERGQENYCGRSHERDYQLQVYGS